MTKQRMLSLLATYLRWNDVAPSRRAPLDVTALAPQVHAFVTDRRDREADDVAASIDRWLIATHGPWIVGWQWSAGDAGGPVLSWSTARESLYREEDADEHASTARVLAAVAEWQAFLVELEALFAELPAGGSWLAQDVEVAAATLVPWVVQQTGCEDAWYRTLTTALTWYAESRGHEPGIVEPIIATVVRGRFASWIEPDPSQVPALAAELSEKLVRLPARVVDATQAWCDLRGECVGRGIHPPRGDALRVDGHRRFIATHERARDRDRADAMEVALDACRESASAGAPLSFDLLARWQSIVLGRAAPLRTRDAYAKQGRERYPYTDDLAERFDALLAEANDHAVPVEVRAARAYLDVCFFHPFEDGNGRAARLALDFVLAREGLGLHAVEPLFILSRSATDYRGVYHFARLVEHLTGPFASG